MVWVKVCDNYAFHSKSRAVGLMGTGLFVHVLQHANRELSDGRYDEADLDHSWPWDVDDDVALVLELLEDVMKAALKPFKGAWPALRRALDDTTVLPEALLSALLERLVQVGFLETRRGGGLQIHNYHRYQPSRRQVEHRREQAAKRQAAKRRRDRAAKEQLSELAAALARADGVEIEEKTDQSRRDAPVTGGVTIGDEPAGLAVEAVVPWPAEGAEGENRRAAAPQGACVAEPSLRSARRTSGHPAAPDDVLMKNDPDPSPLVTGEGDQLSLAESTRAAGAAVARAVRSYEELGRLDPYRVAAQGVRLMERHGRSVESVLTAVERLARDAGCAEMVGKPMSESQLGYWFGRYCDVQLPTEDGGRRSEREHFERKQDEANWFRGGGGRAAGPPPAASDGERGGPPLTFAEIAAGALSAANAAEGRS